MFEFIKTLLKDLFNGIYIIFIALGAFSAGFFYANQITLFGFNPCKLEQKNTEHTAEVKVENLEPEINSQIQTNQHTVENSTNTISNTQPIINQEINQMQAIPEIKKQGEINIIVDPKNGTSSVSITPNQSLVVNPKLSEINSQIQNTQDNNIDQKSTNKINKPSIDLPKIKKGSK